MKHTRVNVEHEAKQKGLEPIQIDGIPEGFSFKAPDVQIGETLHKGQYVAFVPMTESVVWSYDMDKLLEFYKFESEKYGKRN